MRKFIAEVSSNHSQNINRAIEFINIASEIGCYAVKFQLFSAETLYPKGTKEYESVKAVELNPDWVELLNKHAIEKNIFFMAPMHIHLMDLMAEGQGTGHPITALRAGCGCR